MLHYRALWVFGIILALTTVSAGTAWSGGGGGGGNHRPDRISENTWEPEETFPHQWQESVEQANEEINQQFADGIPANIKDTIITIAIVTAIALLILAIVGTIARYVSETALIRMVDDQEATETQKTVREGFKMGWSRAAWKLFLIDLLIDIPAALAFLVLFLIAFAPLLLWTTQSTVAGIIGTVTTSGLFLLLIIAAIAAGEALRLLKHFARRACTLDELGVGASVNKGYTLARSHLKDVGLMWLITAAVRFLWPIALIPAVLLLMLAGILAGGLLALIVGGITVLVSGSATAWIVGGVTGGVIFMLVLALPLIFLEGLREVFLSSTWTLTYRELHAMRVLEPAPLPQTGPQADQAPA